LRVNITPVAGRSTRYVAESVTPLLQSQTNEIAFHSLVKVTRETATKTTTAEHGVDVILSAAEIDAAHELLHGGPR
jgi:hypothetical protein